MANEIPEAFRMKFIGLLTHEQKQAGYFVTQDQDFVWLWWGKNGHFDILQTWLYEDCRIKQVRDFAENHMRGKEMPV